MSADFNVAGSTARPTTDVAIAIREILAEYLHRPLDDIRFDSDLEHDLALDSFALIELTVMLETRLGFSADVAADPDDLTLRTVADLVTYVNERLATRRAPHASQP